MRCVSTRIRDPGAAGGDGPVRAAEAFARRADVGMELILAIAPLGALDALQDVNQRTLKKWSHQLQQLFGTSTPRRRRRVL